MKSELVWKLNLEIEILFDSNMQSNIIMQIIEYFKGFNSKLDLAESEVILLFSYPIKVVQHFLLSIPSR